MLLGVNIDHVATLRNARGGEEPSVIAAALLCKKMNVNGVTVHLREDRRHIKDFDLIELKRIQGLRLNLEMAATPEMQLIALKNAPECCCIVPEKRLEVTTEGGLDVLGQLEKIADFVQPLVNADIQVSLFIAPDESQICAAAKTGAQFIELHTGQYSEAFGKNNEQYEFLRLQKAATLAKSLGLGVNAGHGLNYDNVSRMHEIPELVELNIGHTIIAKAIFVGLENAINEMSELVK